MPAYIVRCKPDKNSLAPPYPQQLAIALTLSASGNDAVVDIDYEIETPGITLDGVSLQSAQLTDVMIPSYREQVVEQIFQIYIPDSSLAAELVFRVDILQDGRVVDTARPTIPLNSLPTGLFASFANGIRAWWNG